MNTWNILSHLYLTFQPCIPLPPHVDAERAEVGRFAKNFLPILFNAYSQQDAAMESPVQRRSVLDTIRAYLTVTEPQVSTVLQNRVRMPLTEGLGWRPISVGRS